MMRSVVFLISWTRWAGQKPLAVMIQLTTSISVADRGAVTIGVPLTDALHGHRFTSQPPQSGRPRRAMDKRAAKREACGSVAELINGFINAHGRLNDGDGEWTEQDHQRFRAALIELSEEMERRAGDRL